MKKMEAIKTYFGQGEGAREVTTKELMDFFKTDKPGFNEVAVLCAAALGVELEDAPAKI